MNAKQQMDAEESRSVRAVVAQTPCETTASDPRGAAGAGPAARILIVDDDVSVTPGLRRLLQEAGLHVDVMTGMRFPLAPAMFDDYRAVIVDVMAPQSNGFEGLRSICSITRLPVLVLTARGAEEDRIAGFAMGADDYVVKPCRPREVVARVRALLRRRATV
jgi:DNA-binding response OmpR family regulator